MRGMFLPNKWGRFDCWIKWIIIFIKYIMATTGGDLGGLLNVPGLGRDENGNLRMTDNKLSTDSGINSGTESDITVLDVFNYACSAKPGDTDYDIKIEIANQIFKDYQNHIESKKDELLTIIKYLSNIEEQDITIEDQKKFKSIILGLQKMDEQNGNYMLKLFEKHPNLVNKFAQAVKIAQTTMSNNAKPTTSDNAKPTTSNNAKPTMSNNAKSTTSNNAKTTTSNNAKTLQKLWKGGNYLSQKGGRVGPFESLKSILSLDTYWELPWNRSSLSHFIYTNGRDTFKNIVDAIADASVPSYNDMDINMERNEPLYLRWGKFDEVGDNIPRSIIVGLYKLCKYAFHLTYFFTWMPLDGILKLIQGTTIITFGIACFSPMLAVEIVELAVKPALLAIDLPASAIASLFRNAGAVAVADAYAEYVGPPVAQINNDDDSTTLYTTAEIVVPEGPVVATPAGGSKKTRHRKKNTKKNKKRKPRNTNRK
jgi:hypothetical protein